MPRAPDVRSQTPAAAAGAHIIVASATGTVNAPAMAEEKGGVPPPPPPLPDTDESDVSAICGEEEGITHCVDIPGFEKAIQDAGGRLICVDCYEVGARGTVLTMFEAFFRV